MSLRRLSRHSLAWAVAGLLGFAAVSPASAQEPSGDGPPAAELASPRKMNKEATKKAANKAIKRSRKVLEASARAAREGGKLKSRLRNAVAHQRAAEAASRGERYDVAIFLALEARKLAGHVLKANAAKSPKELEATRDELKAADGLVESDGSSLVAAAEMRLPDEETVSADLDAMIPAQSPK